METQSSAGGAAGGCQALDGAGPGKHGKCQPLLKKNVHTWTEFTSILSPTVSELYKIFYTSLLKVNYLNKFAY